MTKKTRVVNKTFFQTGDVPTQAQFGDLIDSHASLLDSDFRPNWLAPRRGQVIAQVGDSNTNGRPGWQVAVDLEWKSRGGIFEGCTVYNNGANGSQCAGWVNNITAKVGDARNPSNSETTNPWDVVEGDPDLIIIALGTNDFNTPGGRVSQPASFSTALDTLVEFFLANTKANILLRMPQPFHWGEGSDLFDYFTLWDDDDDAALSSQQMRDAHLDWINRNPRVAVYDSHKHLFGYRCDDKAVDCLDPETNLPLIVDGLHPTNLGYRRVAQQIAEMLSGESYSFRMRTISETIRKTAIWHQDYWVRSSSSDLISIELSPEIARSQNNGAVSAFNCLENLESNPVSRKAQNEIALAQSLLSPIIYQELMSASGNLNILFHATGNSYTFSRPTLSAMVTASSPHYASIVLTGISGSLQAGDVGRCSIWTSDLKSIPRMGFSALVDANIYLPSGVTSSACQLPVSGGISLSNAISLCYAARTGGNAVTYQLRARNQGDGRYVTFETFNSGKPIADIAFDAGIWVPTVTWRGDLWPTGFLVDAAVFFTVDVATGTHNSNLNVTFGRRAGVFPVWTLQPTNQTAANGANATFSVTTTGAAPTSTYVWQVSTDAGDTWTIISGETSSTYVRSVVTGDNGYKFRCLARFVSPDTGASQYLSSEQVTLTVT